MTESSWSVLAGAVGAFGLGAVAAAIVVTARPMPAREPAAIDGAWARERMEDADRVCGPVPFVVEVTRDRISLDCRRPEPLGVVKVRKPRAPIPALVPAPKPEAAPPALVDAGVTP
jgi:hypothetical protein